MTHPNDEAFEVIKDFIIFGIAVIGAGLGILNYWRGIVRDRVKLRLRIQGYVTSHGDSGMCIEIINLGSFAVTVTQVAFDMKGGKQIFVIMPTPALGGKCAPQRLEPRASFTTHFIAGKEKCAGMAHVTRAFASTACGERFNGSSIYLKSCIKAAQAAYKQSTK